MIAKDRLAYMEAVQIARWLTPAPEIAANFAPHRFNLAADQSQDQAAGNQGGSDGSILPDLGALKDMGSWDSVAATLERKVTQLSGFNPASTTFDQQAWENYAYKFGTLPFFLQTNHQHREVMISSLSVDKAVDAVSDMIQTLATGPTVDSVINSIKKIATVAINSEGNTQKNNSQQQGLISTKASQMTIGYLRTSVEMTYKKGKGYEQMTQSLVIYQAYGILDFEKCKRSAATILKWDKSDVDDWERGTSSYDKPPNESPAWGPTNK